MSLFALNYLNLVGEVHPTLFFVVLKFFNVVVNVAVLLPVDEAFRHK